MFFGLVDAYRPRMANTEIDVVTDLEIVLLKV